MSEPTPSATANATVNDRSRRTVVGWAAAFAGVAAAYLTFAAYLGGFLHRTGGRRRFVFVALVADLDAAGGALVWRTPAGAPVNIARVGAGAEDLVALSSTCPHLGCKVHWEAQNRRFSAPATTACSRRRAGRSRARRPRPGRACCATRCGWKTVCSTSSCLRRSPGERVLMVA